MSGSTDESPSCSCGQVVFDVAGRKAGEILSCPWCERQYRYLGSSMIAPFEEAEEETGAAQSKDMAEAEDPAGEQAEAGMSLAERMKAHSAKRKRQQAAVQASKAGPSNDTPKTRAKGRRPGVPGGLLRMIAFIVVSNAIAFVLLQVYFTPHRDGSRTMPWGGTIPRHSVPWPELVALLAGHLCGFVAWACYVYRLHSGQRARAAEQPPQLAAKNGVVEDKT